MYNLLILSSQWYDSVFSCVHMICVSAIIITISILISKYFICKQKNELEKNRTDSILTFTGYTPSDKIVSQKVTIYLDGKTLIANPDISYTSSENNTQPKTKAEETGSIAPDNNNETTEETGNNTPNNNNNNNN